MLISEVAKLANMSKDGIRHYEEMGLITSTPRPAGGRIYREYDASVLETIERIRQAQQLGFTLKEIGPLFKAYAAAKPVSNETMTAFLEARLIIIREKLDGLREVEAFVCGKIDHYRAQARPAKSRASQSGKSSVVVSSKRRRARAKAS